jgi:hypothetical protein
MKILIQIYRSRSAPSLANRLWATTAIGLGVWEATAVSTKKIPTITRTCRMAKAKYRRQTEAAIIAWLLGLGMHLLKHELED